MLCVRSVRSRRSIGESPDAAVGVDANSWSPERAELLPGARVPSSLQKSLVVDIDADQGTLRGAAEYLRVQCCEVWCAFLDGRGGAVKLVPSDGEVPACVVDFNI